MNLKPSIYNYYFDVEDNKIGIYNSFSKALLVLEQNEYYCLIHHNESIPDNIRQVFIKNGILISSTVNEHEAVNIVRTEEILNSQKSVYRIFTTMDCNARCFYCYEKRNKNSYMNEQTAYDIAQFIIDHVGDRSCLIQWFGGEPLMNTAVIDIITSRLRRVLGDNRISFMMITNGSLVSGEIAEKMAGEWNIRRVQVSIDDAYEEYARRKNYISIAAPFDVVLSNIKLLLSKNIFVSLRINYDAENYKRIPELIDILAQSFEGYTNLHVYTYHIFETNWHAAPDALIKEEWFTMQNALIKAGFLAPLEAYSLTVRNTQCFACSAKSFVVMPDGALYKCALATSEKAACVGNIYEGITDYGVLESWCNTALRDECAVCSFLPLCQGGCRAGVLDYISEHCFVQKNFADEVLRERLRYLDSAHI